MSKRTMGVGLNECAGIRGDDNKDVIFVPEEQASLLDMLAPNSSGLSENGINGTPTVSPTTSENVAEEETVKSDELSLVNTEQIVLGYSDSALFQQYAGTNHLAATDQLPFMERMYDLLYKSTNTNITVSIGEVEFDCQKIILMAYSEYFSKMILLPNEVVLPQTDCPAHGFQLVYRWMISDDDQITSLSVDQLVPLWLAAQYLHVMQLLHQLWYCFDQLENINEDIALTIYESALCYGGKASLLQELMLSHITKILMPIVASKRSWLELTEEQVFDMLTKAYLAVNSEVEVFLSILYWLEHDWPARLPSTVRLMSTVRFRLFPIWYLSTVNCIDTSKFLQIVLKIDAISNMIGSAINDIIGSTFQPSKSFAETIKLSMAQPAKPRCWIVDPLCSHHHMRHCLNFKYPKYELFKSYLGQVRERESTYSNSLLLPELAYAESMSCCATLPSSLPKYALVNAIYEST